MTLPTRIQRATHYLFFCSLEQHLRQGFQSIWFWFPLIYGNYSEFLFPYLGIVYVGGVLIGLLWTWPQKKKLSHVDYYLDCYDRTQGEISAWFEHSQGAFAALLESRIEQYPSLKIPRLPPAKIFLWILPIFLLLFYPVFRSKDEWRLYEKKQKIREQLEALENSSSLNASLQEDLKELQKQLESGETTWEELLQQMQKLEQKAKKSLPFSASEQKLLEQIFKQVPQFQEWLQKKAPELEKFLEEEKIPTALQEKILTNSPEELAKKLQQSQQIQALLLNPVQSILPKVLSSQEFQTKNNSLQEVKISWPEGKSFPDVPASPRFRELLEHLGKDFLPK